MKYITVYLNFWAVTILDRAKRIIVQNTCTLTTTAYFIQEKSSIGPPPTTW